MRRAWFFAGGGLQYLGSAGNSTDILFSVLGGSTSTFIDSSGTGNLAFTNTGNIANFSNTQAIALYLDGGTTYRAQYFRAPAIVDFAAGNSTTLNKTGNGTWVLMSPNSNYSGGTLITQGTLGLGTSSGHHGHGAGRP